MRALSRHGAGANGSGPTRVVIALALATASGCGGAASPAPQTAVPDAGAEPVEDATVRLRALGYASWDEPSAAPPRGAVVHDAARVAPGWNVYADDVDRVLAVDRDGAVQRVWRVPGRTQVEYATVMEGGRVLALSVDEGLTLLEPDGALVWHVDLACHHDVAVRPGDPPGTRHFAVATHSERSYAGRRVRFDEVRVIAEATGAVDAARALDSFALREAWAAPYAAAGGRHALDTSAAAPSDTVYDYFHLNSLEWEVDGAGRESLLVCLRNVDTVAVVAFPSDPADPRAGAVLWHADPRALEWPHMPRRLGPEADAREGASPGEVLVFDNGPRRGWSRVAVADARGAVRTRFVAAPPEAFFSALRGGVQRLANGNLLVTESERGRVFELCPDGTLAWEYWNPERRGTAVRRIYRMTRIDEARFR